MNEKLKEKTMEALMSVLPITGIVLLLSITVVPLENGTLVLFLTGALLLIVGMGIFQLGAEMAMTPLGQGVGSRLVKGQKLGIILLVSFLMGTIITISEPDLQVLANQVAFDAGGVTTGPMTVPFIMAIGVGLSAARSDKEGAADSFGLVALCSIGPIMMVLLLGIFYHPTDAVYTAVEIPPVDTTYDVAKLFVQELPHYAREVMISVMPVVGVYIIFQLLTKNYHRRQVLRMSVGFVYTLIGLILFLTGVNVGFAPVGNLLGSGLTQGWMKSLLVPIGIVIGYYIVKAEPAVQVLNDQVEEITGGVVSRSMMNLALSLGVACAVALAMLRVLTGISIYWIIIPGYIIALALTKFVPPVFVGIAFDSGGVASGPMTSTFLLPLAMGACTALGGNVVTDAFGVVALVAMAPLIAIQVMGIVYTRKTKATKVVEDNLNDDIVVELEEE